MSRSTRKPTNLSLDEDLVSAARALNVNVSRAAEEGIARAIRAERERRHGDQDPQTVSAQPPA